MMLSISAQHTNSLGMLYAIENDEYIWYGI